MRAWVTPGYSTKYEAFFNRKTKAFILSHYQQPPVASKGKAPETVNFDRYQTDDDTNQLWQTQKASLEDNAEKVANEIAGDNLQAIEGIQNALANFKDTLKKLKPGQQLPNMQEFKKTLNELVSPANTASSSPKPQTKSTQ